MRRLADRLLGLAARPGPAVRTDRDLPIPMSDGTVLLADRHHHGGDRPMPVVLVRTPYGRAGLLMDLLFGAYARQGLQVLVVSARGTFGSGGEFLPMRQEQRDGLDTTAWVREQPWCDGRLAGAGFSYLGHTQWAVAAELDPPFEALGLGITSSSFNDWHFEGGTLALQGNLSWAVTTARQEEPLLRRLGQARRTRRAMSHLPLKDADLAAIGRRSRYWREISGHAEPGDDFWAATDHSASVSKVTSPTTMVTGWYDIFLPRQLADFTALAAAGTAARLTVGPWAHGEDMPETIRDQVSWLRHHLYGEALADRAPVRLFLQQAGTWLDLPSWPPPGNVPLTLHLHDGGRLREEPASGGWSGFTYDPADPTPAIGGALLSGRFRKQQDQAVVESRPDVSVYTADPLTEHLDVVGEMSATIRFQAEPGFADVVVRLCDVDERGVSRNVSEGVVRLRDAREARDVEVPLWPTAYRFRRGHRVRVQVTGGAFPTHPRNHGTGQPIAEAVDLLPSRHQVHHEGSYLTLSRRGRTA